MNKTFKALSSIAIASFACLFAACGESSSNVHSDDEEISEQEFDEDDEDEISSDSKNVKSSSSERDEKASNSADEVSAKFSGKVSGVSQKGPFVVGSTVTLHELDGESFDLSGRSFVNKIKNDKGEFEVSYKDLSSNYALFIADGYYRNEVTGKKSVSPITLNALSDLTDRNTVNVNILTHLEFERVKYLTMSKGVEYGKAKAQAEKEILDAFGISFKEGSSAEDLSIFGSTENDGALLALSVLMQGTSAEGDFSERLSLVAQDLEEDGTIDDEQVLAEIADEVALMDLSKVRKNIEAWKLSATVPDFEKFVETYWTTNYGIGTCTAEDISKAAKNVNELSENYKKTYVCEESGWRLMTADEGGFGTCAANEDGKRFEKSRICDGGKWRSLTAEESMGACTEEKIGETAVEENELSKNFEKKHVCDKDGWRVMTADEAKYGTCAVNEDGKRFEKSRICEGGEWRSLTADESMGACTEEKIGETTAEKNELSENFEKKFVCDKNGWRLMTADEEKYGICSANEDGKHLEKSRICDGGKWRTLTADESMGACTEEKIGKTAVEENELSKNFEKKHVCDKNGWRLMTDDEEKYGICSANDDGKHFEKTRICKKGNWYVMNANESMGTCSEDNVGKTAVEENELSENYDVIHVCDGKAWHVVSDLEEKLGYCTSANARQSVPEKNFWYVCDGSKWRDVDKYGLDVYTLACEKDGDIVYSEKNKVYNVCRNGFAEPPKLNDLSIGADFTADVWNGATDSKVRLDNEEYLLKSDIVGMHTYFTDIRNSKNESVFNNVSLNLITYNNNGKSSTLSDKGVKFLYAPRWDDQLGADFNMISAYVDFEDGKDISDWEGVCVVYASSVPLTVSVSDVSVENFANIPASMELTVANLKWEDLDDYEGGLALDIVKTTKKLSVDVYLGGAEKMLVPPAGVVYIAGIGKYNGCSVK